MPAPRGIRKEDRIAHRLAQTLVHEGQRILVRYRANIKALPEVADQYARARVTSTTWEAYITRLALASLSGEDTLHIIADFNQRYIFLHREAQSDLHSKNG